MLSHCNGRVESLWHRLYSPLSLHFHYVAFYRKSLPISTLTSCLLGSSFANLRAIINSSICSENYGRLHIWDNLMIAGIPQCELQSNSSSELQHLFKGQRGISSLLYLTIMLLLSQKFLLPLQTPHPPAPHRRGKCLLLRSTATPIPGAVHRSQWLHHSPFNEAWISEPISYVSTLLLLICEAYLFSLHNSLQAIPLSVFPLLNPTPVPIISHCIIPVDSQFISHINFSKHPAYKCQTWQNSS